MTLMEHCPQAFQEGYTLLAGSRVGEDGEDLSRQVIRALEERKPQGTKKKRFECFILLQLEEIGNSFSLFVCV